MVNGGAPGGIGRDDCIRLNTHLTHVFRSSKGIYGKAGIPPKLSFSQFDGFFSTTMHFLSFIIYLTFCNDH